MKNKPYRFYLYLLLKFAIFLFRLLPRRAALVFAKSLGSLAFWTVSRQRNKVLENLVTAFGSEKTPREIRKIGREVFENLAMNMADLVLMKRFTRSYTEKLIDLNGVMDRSRELLQEGKGLLFFSGHLGNWELMGALYGIWGFTGGVVGRRIYYDKYNDLIVGARLEKGVPTFYQDDNPRELLRQLRKGGVIGIVADQDVEKLEGVFVDYFGRPAYTPVAPIRIAQVSGAPILVGALIRKGDRYEAVYHPEPIRVPRDADEKTLLRLTQEWSKALEDIIRQYPAQWVWMHNRWKTRAGSEANVSRQPDPECPKEADLYLKFSSLFPKEVVETC